MAAIDPEQRVTACGLNVLRSGKQIFLLAQGTGTMGQQQSFT
jgi:hypothetical protein